MKKYLFPLSLFYALSLAAGWNSDVGRSSYPSAKVRTEGVVINGLLDGPSIMYYESGVKISETNYRSGLLHGKTTSFYESGEKKSEALYQYGILNGISITWDESGRKAATANFQNGRIVD